LGIGSRSYSYSYSTSIPEGQKRLLGCLEIIPLAIIGAMSMIDVDYIALKNR